jgi:hypothetical protein
VTTVDDRPTTDQAAPPRTFDGRTITEVVTKFTAKSGSIPVLPLGATIIVVLVGRNTNPKGTYPSDTEIELEQTITATEVLEVSAEHRDTLIAELRAARGRKTGELTLPLTGSALLNGAADRLNRDELLARDEDGRRDLEPEHVRDDSLAGVAKLSDRQAALAALMTAGDGGLAAVMVEPGLLDDLEFEGWARVGEDHGMAWCWVTARGIGEASVVDVVDGVLADVEQQHPQVRAEQAGRRWHVAWPSMVSPFVGQTWDRLGALQDAVAIHVHGADVNGFPLERLDWTKARAGFYTADLPVDEPELSAELSEAPAGDGAPVTAAVDPFDDGFDGTES